MATPVGRTDPSLAQLLTERAWEFDFFQAMRLLARICPRPRLISGFRQSFEEQVRFHAHLSVEFPASMIQSIGRPATEAGPAHAVVNFLGLTGTQGVLPTHYTEYLIARAQAHDSAAAAFFDLFNHRLISFFYLAWEKHHFAVGFEGKSFASGPFCPLSPDSSGRFTQYLFDYIGMGTPGLLGCSGINDFVLLSYAGLIAQRPRSAVALRGLLADYFQLPVEIKQFVGKWCRLEPETLSFLEPNGFHNQLGQGALAGDHVWNRQARFLIRMGPLSWERFNSFLPDGPAFRELVCLTRFFVNQSLEFNVQLVLLANEVPWCTTTGDAGSPRLGLSSWLKTDAFEEDASDLVVAVPSLASESSV
ncbi:MAG: type VI secretion system baseplate subunit TssG [Acidobacteriia bacterium]|nr:type VI secretion system baseplate subunit TssG [Terriglobia bacterium]